MNVYVLEQKFVEGASEILGVYDTQEKAEAAAVVHNSARVFFVETRDGVHEGNAKNVIDYYIVSREGVR